MSATKLTAIVPPTDIKTSNTAALVVGVGATTSTVPADHAPVVAVIEVLLTYLHAASDHLFVSIP